MFKFIKNLVPKNTENKKSNELLLKIASLLIHAAKIDENFTDKERKIIETAIINLGAETSAINFLRQKKTTRFSSVGQGINQS